MNVATTDPKQIIKEANRCPVFKINLKGHFVNVDDLTSELIGLPAESLFGRNIKEFLDKESFNGLSQIIQHGNRFDACYEAIEIKIINNEKKQHKVNAIVSLNFIAGNPANYQIILLKYNQTKKSDDKKYNLDCTLKKLYELSFDFARNPDWKKLSDLLINSIKINQVGIYKYSDKTLFLLTESSKQKKKSNVDLSRTNEDHLKVVTNKQSKTLDLKDNGLEYSFPLVINGFCWGLLRCIVENNLSELDSALAIIAGYIGPAFGADISDNAKNEKKQKIEKSENKTVDIQLNFFDILKMFGCTIISFDTSGDVISKYTDLPDKNHFLAGCSTSNELIDKLSAFELIGFSDKECFELTLSDEHPVIFPDLGLIGDENKFYLYKILKTKEISDGLAENTIILFPEFDNSIGRNSTNKLLEMFLETSSMFLEPIDKCAAKMAGQFYPRLNKDGRFYLDTIQDNCYVLFKTINRFKQLCQIINKKENLVEINITDVVSRTIKEYLNIENNIKIKLENSGQIFLMADSGRITKSLYAIFTGLINQTISNEKPTISLKVSTETKYCKIQINSYGTLENSFKPENALEALTSIRETPVSGLSVLENELPMARLLIESMGGQMELSQIANNKVSIDLKLPSAR
ncbi:MAG: hypothetical protein GY865_01450 [candidate division Zixibacteria bacterium]|nr:hypothetical protein [candidate division Zixibacteria bacterium]